ncbi:hypothetical protein VTK73DRAFT_10294 [Phialemonium thermophilum]|uniref:Antifreeze protein n=1 Tax=Phialemonium thermophilum TaxID=223376 RepID=A0ABR3VXG4_9PEZI
MKSFTTLLVLLASSASLVAAIPADRVIAARVNEAANNGDKGIEAADEAALAVALAQAGDIGAATTGAAFAAATKDPAVQAALDALAADDAKISADDAAAAQATAAPAANNNADNKNDNAKDNTKGNAKDNAKNNDEKEN